MEYSARYKYLLLLLATAALLGVCLNISNSLAEDVDADFSVSSPPSTPAASSNTPNKGSAKSTDKEFDIFDVETKDLGTANSKTPENPAFQPDLQKKDVVGGTPDSGSDDILDSDFDKTKTAPATATTVPENTAVPQPSAETQSPLAVTPATSVPSGDKAVKYEQLKTHLNNFIKNFESKKLAANTETPVPATTKADEQKPVDAATTDTPTAKIETKADASVPSADDLFGLNTGPTPTPNTPPTAAPVETANIAPASPSTNSGSAQAGDTPAPAASVAEATTASAPANVSNTPTPIPSDNPLAEFANAPAVASADSTTSTTTSVVDSAPAKTDVKTEPEKTENVAAASPVALPVTPETTKSAEVATTAPAVLSTPEAKKEEVKEIVKEEAKTTTTPQKKSENDKAKSKKPPVISDEDKEYIASLEEQKKSLPKNKQLSDKTMGTIEKVTPSIIPEKSTKKELTPERLDMEKDELSDTIKEKDGTLKSKNFDMSVKSSSNKDKKVNNKDQLDTAYRALLAGQIAAAISIYKDIIDKYPDNKDALFGLATAYHRNSQFEQARAIYTEILEKDPNNKEVLNNFLVLVAEESPESALIELEKLERLNSGFSPIPAQIAMIHLKLNHPDQAERYLKRAVLLSPENITYKYNLAITSDKIGKEEQAARLYSQILEAVRRGAVIPGDPTKVMDRLSYLEQKLNLSN